VARKQVIRQWQINADLDKRLQISLPEGQQRLARRIDVVYEQVASLTELELK